MSEKTLKKEFITTWTQQPVGIRPSKMSSGQMSFFDSTVSMTDFYTYDESEDAYEYAESVEESDAILPNDIKFSDLLGFAGHRTKVTIEIIPW